MRLDLSEANLTRIRDQSKYEKGLARRQALRSGVRIRDVDLGHESSRRLIATRLTPSVVKTKSVAVFVHGGGTVAGSRYTQLPSLIPLVSRLGFVAYSIEYRLAPEFPYPHAVEDIQQAIAELGGGRHARARSIVLIGASAGGAISISALAREPSSVKRSVLGLMLWAPMLSPFSPAEPQHQKAGITWTAQDNEQAWRMYLGQGASLDGNEVPAFIRTREHFPPTYVDCGSRDVFLPAAREFVRTLGDVGVSTEFKLFAGAVHGFDHLQPNSLCAKRATAERAQWLVRLLR